MRYFTLLKLVQIYKCQNQKLLIPIFAVYEAPDVQSTKFKHESSVTDICHENPDNIFVFFLVIFAIFLWIR